MADIFLDAVVKRYSGNVFAINHVDLEIKDKEFLVLLGASGCGKSTLLRMIAGIEELTDGAIFIDSMKVNDVEPKDRDIAMVFQNYALYPHMTVQENMEFGLKIKKIDKRERQRRIHEAAEILDITSFLERYPSALSGGQRQRVAIGRAIVKEPKVFLMDEPLSNLDSKLRTHMRLEIKKLHERLKCTFVYVTHDQVEAVTLGDRIAVMNGGRIVQIASPKEIIDHPVNQFVATFIGTPQMNLLPAVIRTEKSGVPKGTGEGFAPKGCVQMGTVCMEIVREYPALEDGRPVTVGIRAEHCSITNELCEGALKMTVDICEVIGTEMLVHLTCGRTPFVVKTESDRSFHPGDLVLVAFDTEHMHLFDRTTEVNLLDEGEQQDKAEQRDEKEKLTERKELEAAV